MINQCQVLNFHEGGRKWVIGVFLGLYDRFCQ